jgi:hypothetical protein
MKKEKQIGVRVGLPAFFALELEDVYRHTEGAHRALAFPDFIGLLVGIGLEQYKKGNAPAPIGNGEAPEGKGEDKSVEDDGPESGLAYHAEKDNAEEDIEEGQQAGAKIVSFPGVSLADDSLTNEDKFQNDVDDFLREIGYIEADNGQSNF